MKRTIFIITALLGAGCMLNAQQTIGVTTDNLKIERNGEYIVCLLYTSDAADE